MKNLRMISGITHQVDDDEAENIKIMWAEDSKRPILLRNNTMINPACIESIGDVALEELEAYWGGNKMNKSRTRVLVDGEWKIFCGSERDIEWRDKNGNIVEQESESAKMIRINRKNYLKNHPEYDPNETPKESEIVKINY